MHLRTGLAAIVVSASALLGCEFLDNKSTPECLNCDCTQKPKNTSKYCPESYIRSSKYKSLQIQIDAIAGVEPIKEEDVRILESILSTIIDKPEGITHVYRNRNILSEKKVYTHDDLTILGNKHRGENADQLSLYILYMNGSYHFANIAGVALDDGMIFIFRENVPASLDKCILMHEAGHQFGLVGKIPQQRVHEDTQHEGHDANDVCVMFYKLTSQFNYLFDKQCLEDIAAVRKK